MFSTSSYLNFSFVCVLLSFCRDGCRDSCKRLGCLAGFPSRHPTLDVGEQDDRFPSVKFSPGAYVRRRNPSCGNAGRSGKASGARGAWPPAMPALAVLPSVLLGGVAKSFWSCRPAETWRLASAVAASRNKSCRPQARPRSSSQPQLTEPEDRASVPAGEICEKRLLNFSPLHCGSPCCLFLKCRYFRHVHKMAFFF